MPKAKLSEDSNPDTVTYARLKFCNPGESVKWGQMLR